MHYVQLAPDSSASQSWGSRSALNPKLLGFRLLHCVRMIESCSSLIVCGSDFNLYSRPVTALSVKLCDACQCWAAAVRARGEPHHSVSKQHFSHGRTEILRFINLVHEKMSLQWTHTTSVTYSPSTQHPISTSANCQLCKLDVDVFDGKNVLHGDVCCIRI